MISAYQLCTVFIEYVLDLVVLPAKRTVAKHLWYIANGKICLWVKWVHGLYVRNQSIWNITVKENASWCWRKILEVQGRVPLGTYTISSGYNWLMGLMVTDPLARIVWSRFNVPRHAFCFWRLALKRLSTKDRLAMMRIIKIVSYVSTMRKPASIFSLSPHSRVLQNVFSQFGFHTGLCKVEDNLVAPAYCKMKKTHKQVLYVCITTIVYCLWTERKLKYT
ncbi:LOW QUALITY PROTEIN: hypothetical protein Cgig2_009027 [Carnegiea gigantea]|uniref:Reverse transcriptase zinc-binding domain-containing protein n=1 Tax=Carnegiea gigantea TaxID=171969 RepID=A0A9Q1QHK3_9CARY|nr:LOW QUALITY PROTEIN: hypothetical protein Cgig2_009027 [Carnegiea gigantea]